MKSEVSSNDVVPQIITNEVSYVGKIASFYFWEVMGHRPEELRSLGNQQGCLGRIYSVIEKFSVLCSWKFP